MIEPATLPDSIRPRRCLHCGGYKTLIFEVGSGTPPRQLCLLPDCQLAEQRRQQRAQPAPLPGTAQAVIPGLQARQGGQ